MITPALLDALLSPDTLNDSPRSRAEAFLQSKTTQERVYGFLTLLRQPELSESHLLLSAVLLRRDIAKLAGDSANIGILKECMEPLLNCLNNRMVRHCLAELCASLSFLSPSDGDNAFATIWNRVTPMVRKERVYTMVN